MNPEKHEQFADRWLDIALKQYTAVEPPSGCEARILENLARASRPRRFFLLQPVRFAWTAVAAALVLGAVFVGTSLHGPTQTHSAQIASLSPTKLPPVAVQPAAPSRIPALEIFTGPIRHRTQQSKAARPAPPRRELFPSPAPLSEDELLLLAYLRSTPKEEILFAASRSKAEHERAQELLNFDTTLDQGSRKGLQ